MPAPGAQTEPPRPGLCLALLGAESTGKTALAQALALRLAADTGLRVTWVAETLREWCDAQGRTPRSDEQFMIALTQADRITTAAASHDLVVCDTTPLMTAVYSRQVFGDRSLDAWALDWHQTHITHTLLTALDLPWQADGLQRDGPQVRTPVDNRVREHLLGAGLPWSLVRGLGQARVESALDALVPVLRQAGLMPGGSPQPPSDRSRSLFGGLLAREARREVAQARWVWSCADCDDPDCEHALRQR